MRKLAKLEAANFPLFDKMSPEFLQDVQVSWDFCALLGTLFESLARDDLVEQFGRKGVNVQITFGRTTLWFVDTRLAITSCGRVSMKTNILALVSARELVFYSSPVQGRGIRSCTCLSMGLLCITRPRRWPKDLLEAPARSNL